MCYSVFSNLPLLPHHVTTFSPRPMHVYWDHWKGWGGLHSPSHPCL